MRSFTSCAIATTLSANCLVAWAQAMGHTEAVGPLQPNLDEETAANRRLTNLAEGGLNDAATPSVQKEDASQPSAPSKK
ncbi:hypothetical protein LuPra_01634 [Luteitalea pratensis]|uniref:Uncharacterized protein n=1 Tax=Luteitalea pratensis TaxID=1855912 RepID=A0A143PKW5_LUTPR|nr:DUF892 family protein [Luteitalea pratensis]AMY08434.1 hypothetical protein LuPra_01634 [Luteitalea pratensis]